MWEWFIQPIYGEIGDGLFLFYQHYIIYIYICVCVLRRYIQIILCTHHHRQLIKKEPLAISRVLLASQLGMID